MPPTTGTGDISHRTNGYISRQLLKRAQPLLVLQRFGQGRPLEKHQTKTIRFRGYEALADSPKTLVEGVTPQASKITYRDVVANVIQYGDYVELTDVLHDTIEDPLIPEFSEILGEQAGKMLENVTASIVTAGTNVFYLGTTAAGVQATSRGEVSKTLDLNAQRAVIRALRRQDAPRVTKMIAPSEKYDTTAVPASYVAVAHTDMEQAIRDLPGFEPAEKYAQGTALPGELGTVEGIRYVLTTMLKPWEGAGSASATGMVCSDGSGCADVYPILYLGKEPFGVVPFAFTTNKSGDAMTSGAPVTTYVLNPGIARGGDPLGQRGTIGWKAMYTAVILYELWMARVECTVASL